MELVGPTYGMLDIFADTEMELGLLDGGGAYGGLEMLLADAE